MSGPVTYRPLPGMIGMYYSQRISTGGGPWERGTYFAKDESGTPKAPRVDDQRRSVVARPDGPREIDAVYARRAIGQLVERIKREETPPDVAKAGMGILRRVRHPNAVETMLELLADENELDGIRLASIYALAEIGEDRAVEHLVTTLRDPANSSEVRASAAGALGEFDALTVVGSVVRDEGLPSVVRAEALWGLKSLSDTAAAKLLLEEVASYKPPSIDSERQDMMNILIAEADESVERVYDVSIVAREVLGEPNFLMEMVKDDLRQHTQRPCPADNMLLGADIFRRFRRKELSHDEHLKVIKHLMECGVCRARDLEIWVETKHEQERDLIGEDMYAALEPLLKS